MSKSDDFDKFLKNSFQKVESSIKDEGFTEKTISNLPSIGFISFKRNIILFMVSVLSVTIFIISSGYKSLFNSIFDIFNNGFYLIRPSLISFFIIAFFISVLYYIASIVYDKNTI